MNKKEFEAKISVVIPIYNADKYLNRCIESICNQTLVEIEIICIDDGSSDGSWDIIQAYAKRDKRIKAITQQNQGVAAARNAGLETAKGEYIGFVDSDDYVSPHYFRELYDAAKKSNADIARGYFKVDLHQEEDVTQKFGSDTSSYENYYNEHIKNLVLKSKFNQQSSVCSSIYRRSMVVDNNLSFNTDIHAGEDSLFNIGAGYFANEVVYAKSKTRAIYYRVMRSDSIMTGFANSSQGLGSRVKGLEETIKILNTLSEYPADAYANHSVNALHQVFSKVDSVPELDANLINLISDKVSRIWRKVKHKEIILSKYKDIDDRFIYVLGSKNKLKQNLEKYTISLSNPKFSIIVPVYNQEKYLDKCMSDILGQSLKNFEVICVDDGSTDRSLEMLRKYEKGDYRLKVFEQKNSGSAVARNKGLLRAKGEYVLFLDSDDEFSIDLLKECSERLEEKPTDILVYNYVSFNSETGETTGDPISDFDDLPKYKTYSAKNIPDFILLAFYNSVWTKAFRREFLMRYDITFDKDLRRAQDALFANSALALASSIQVINKPLVRYRIHENQSWHTINKYPQSGIDYIKKLRGFLIENELLPKLERSFSNRCISDIRYSLRMLLPHNEFDAVFNECKKILKEFGLPAEGDGYYFDSVSASHIDVILNLEPADYYRLMMREGLMELDMLRVKNKQQDRVIDEIVTSRSWKITRPLRWAVEKKRQFLKQ